MKYILYGINEYALDEWEEGTHIGEYKISLAIFDELEDAEEYVELSKTSSYSNNIINYENHNQFKEDSLLFGYIRGEIEEYYDLPRNPRL